MSTTQEKDESPAPRRNNQALHDVLRREIACWRCETTASTSSPRLVHQSEALRSGRHCAPFQFWSQALSSIYPQHRFLESWSICIRRRLFMSETTSSHGLGPLLSSSLSRLTRSFAVKVTNPRKPRSDSFFLKSSYTATRMVVSFWTCLFKRRQLRTSVAIPTYAHFERVVPKRIQCSVRHLGPQNSVVDENLGDTVRESCKAYCQHPGDKRHHGRLTSILAFS